MDFLSISISIVTFNDGFLFVLGLVFFFFHLCFFFRFLFLLKSKVNHLNNGGSFDSNLNELFYRYIYIYTCLYYIYSYRNNIVVCCFLCVCSLYCSISISLSSSSSSASTQFRVWSLSHNRCAFFHFSILFIQFRCCSL